MRDRARTTPVRPRELPAARDDLVSELRDPTSMTVRNAVATGLPELGEALADAPLYWVTADMAALAVHAGESLPRPAWGAGEAPASSGLMALDGGIGMMRDYDADIPVDAVAWTELPGGGYRLAMLTDRSRMLDQARAPVLRRHFLSVPRLLMMALVHLPGGPDLVDDGHCPDSLGQSIAAAWALMGQPGIADAQAQPAHADARRAYQRAGRPAPDVALVDLRRRPAQPRESDPAQDAGEGRTWRHRWVVSGHWRQQPYGPRSALRRPTWVEAHVKGPDDAPLLTRVNVWRA